MKERVFVGFSLKEESKKSLILLQDKVDRSLSKTKISYSKIKPQNLHTTVCFLGWLSLNKIEQILDLLDKYKNGSYVFNFGSLKVFPSAKYPRVICVSPAGECREYGSFQKSLVEELRARGFKNLRFSPLHITLFRFSRRNSFGKYKVGVLSGVQRKFSVLNISVATRRLELFRSVRSEQGMNYVPYNKNV